MIDRRLFVRGLGAAVAAASTLATESTLGQSFSAEDESALGQSSPPTPKPRGRSPTPPTPRPSVSESSAPAAADRNSFAASFASPESKSSPQPTSTRRASLS